MSLQIADAKRRVLLPELARLLSVPGMTPEQVGAFYAAAADYFRAAPWKRTGHEAAVRVACEAYQGGPW